MTQDRGGSANLASSCARATDEQLAELLGVPVATLASGIASIPEFARDVRLGRLLADGTVANSLYSLAITRTWSSAS